jgi:hypothetical protein
MKSSDIKTEKDIDEYLAKSELKRHSEKAKEEKAAFLSRLSGLVVIIVLLFVAGYYAPFRIGIANVVNELVYDDYGHFIAAGIILTLALIRMIFDYHIKHR